MRPDIKKLLHRIYAIAFSVITVLAGLCLMGGSYYIYTSGQGYSPALISAVFSKISPLLWLWLAMALGGIVLQLTLPREEAKNTPVRSQPSKKAAPAKPHRTRLSYFLLALGIVLVVLGVWGGGLAGVIAKAVAICTECIGLG